MFNKLFKRNPTNNEVVVAEPKAITKGKTTNQIIEEIHESFYTEVDRLLASAKIAKSLDTDKQDLIDKCARLQALGFTNTKEVREAQDEIQRLNEAELENKNKAKLIETINYFSFKYPNYKFITEDGVKKICAKYNLVYGEISRYLGTVPDKNLKQIEDFKIDDDDNCGLMTTTYISMHNMRTGKNYISKREIESYLEAKNSPDKYKSYISPLNMHTHKHFSVAPMEIAAPAKDFNMKGMEVKDFQLSKIEIPDPVVLKPVYHNGKKHYLIVSAWGIEGSDELVINQKMN